MMSNIVYVAVSLDGFIAGPNGELEWLNSIENPDGGDYGFAKFMKRIDAIVMGRKTFEFAKAFQPWPYDKPVFVFSTTIRQLDPTFKGKVELVSGSPPDIVKNLNARGLKNLYVDGGQTIQSFLKAGLIDTLILTRVPILLGNGISLFPNNGNQIGLKHVKTVTYSNGLVKSEYSKVTRGK